MTAERQAHAQACTTRRITRPGARGMTTADRVAVLRLLRDHPSEFVGLRDRAILVALCDATPPSYEEIGLRHGITRQRVGQIVQAALATVGT